MRETFFVGIWDETLVEAVVRALIQAGARRIDDVWLLRSSQTAPPFYVSAAADVHCSAAEFARRFRGVSWRAGWEGSAVTARNPASPLAGTLEPISRYALPLSLRATQVAQSAADAMFRRSRLPF